MTPDQFKAWRLRHGWTQEGAAKALGISHRSVRNIEVGEEDVRLLIVNAVRGVDRREAKIEKRKRAPKIPRPKPSIDDVIAAALQSVPRGQTE